MAGIDEEDEFSDDILDSLNPEDFQQLQEEAYAATQVEQAFPSARHHGFHDAPQAQERPTLLTSNATPAIDNLATDKPTAIKEPPQAQRAEIPTLRNGALASKFRVPSFAQGLGESTQREQWRQQRYAGNVQTRPAQAQDDPSNGKPPLTLPHRVGKSSQEPDRTTIVIDDSDSQQNGDHLGGVEDFSKLKQELEQVAHSTRCGRSLELTHTLDASGERESREGCQGG